MAFGETELTVEQEAQLSALLARRKTGEPVAHLVGSASSGRYLVRLSGDADPTSRHRMSGGAGAGALPAAASRILDLGTGTGAIALALATERPIAPVTAVDVMPDAVALAQRNVERLGVTNVTVLQSSWFSALEKQTFAMIVSNPPISTNMTRTWRRGMFALNR
ncbi:N5-glutamine S-adenosyl-L-methionine-dependent methyltransferase [Enterobacter cloacae]|uniref:N5-glutamine S-adenosyl-L-methionine-dependent methyltransferase n=1 Tax=Enterobacter cloacae TaxID=550 RepID=A0A377LZP6_ENTCL|nr:N5-glutamine S-adenosyl-L-methionine-dependent methyltransferase [Enterobacter cloacae]